MPGDMHAIMFLAAEPTAAATHRLEPLAILLGGDRPPLHGYLFICDSTLLPLPAFCEIAIGLCYLARMARAQACMVFCRVRVLTRLTLHQGRTTYIITTLGPSRISHSTVVGPARSSSLGSEVIARCIGWVFAALFWAVRSDHGERNFGTASLNNRCPAISPQFSYYKITKVPHMILWLFFRRAKIIFPQKS